MEARHKLLVTVASLVVAIGCSGPDLGGLGDDQPLDDSGSGDTSTGSKDTDPIFDAFGDDTRRADTGGDTTVAPSDTTPPSDTGIAPTDTTVGTDTTPPPTDTTPPPTDTTPPPTDTTPPPTDTTPPPTDTTSPPDTTMPDVAPETLSTPGTVRCNTFTDCAAGQLCCKPTGGGGTGYSCNAEPACSSTRFTCDEKADCSSGNSCCGSGPGATVDTSTCKGSCGGSDSVLCSTNADCATGTCRPFMTASGWLGRCE